MKKSILFILVSFFIMGSAFAAEEKVMTISTTTSTENSGLLNAILPQFTAETGITVKVVSKGTGAAIKDGMDGNVDAILVHDTPREIQFVEEGYGTARSYVMYNDFVLIGPAEDKAMVKNAKNATEAFTAIANTKAPFISRGDDSGTHAKESLIWSTTQVPLKDKFPIDTAWYFSIGQGMGKTILMANEKQAYTLADRATFYAMKLAEPATTDLEILYEGSEDLLNPYGYIPVNPAKYPHVKAEYAQALGDWLMSEKGKNAIEGFTAKGKQLFFIPM